MSRNAYLWTGIALMALFTYLVRVLPMILVRRKIRSPFIRSFLYYVPYTVLSAMTFPAIFFSTNSLASACIGTGVALVLAYFRKSLVVVALAAAASVLIVQCLGI